MQAIRFASALPLSSSSPFESITAVSGGAASPALVHGASSGSPVCLTGAVKTSRPAGFSVGAIPPAGLHSGPSLPSQLGSGVENGEAVSNPETSNTASG
jgi:hypothetical protein